MIGYLFVLAAVANQLQHLQLARREVFFTKMLREKSRHLCRDMPFARMNGSDNCQQYVLWHAFENVTRRPRTECTLNLAVGVRRRQHDNSCVRKLSANCD